MKFRADVLNVPFIWIGTEDELDEALAVARSGAPAIIFVEDIDEVMEDSPKAFDELLRLCEGPMTCPPRND